MEYARIPIVEAVTYLALQTQDLRVIIPRSHRVHFAPLEVFLPIRDVWWSDQRSIAISFIIWSLKESLLKVGMLFAVNPGRSCVPTDESLERSVTEDVEVEAPHLSAEATPGDSNVGRRISLRCLQRTPTLAEVILRSRLQAVSCCYTAQRLDAVRSLERAAKQLSRMSLEKAEKQHQGALAVATTTWTW